MNSYLPTVIEVVAMVLLWLVALGLSRALRQAGGSSAGTPTGAGSLLKFVFMPVLVLGLTWALVLLVGYLPGPDAWGDGRYPAAFNSAIKLSFEMVFPV